VHHHPNLTTILFILGSVLFIWVSQPMISSKGMCLLPFPRWSSLGWQKQRQKIVACQINCQDTLALGSPRYPMTNIA